MADFGFRTIHLLTDLFAISFLFHALSVVVGAVDTFDGASIRSRDVYPSLGRGYSVSAGTFSSGTCLSLETTSKPTYDYDYRIIEITNSRNDVLLGEELVNSGLLDSGAFSWISATLANDVVSAAALSDNDATENVPHHSIGQLRILKYFSTIKSARLTDDANYMLNFGDFLSFVQSCGPTYIRSLRRKSEIISIFRYDTPYPQANRAKNDKIIEQVQGLVNDRGSITAGTSTSTNNTLIASTTADATDETTTQTDILEGLTVEIRAFGLGGGQSDSPLSPVIQSWASLASIVDFSFRSIMGQNAGVVDSIEVVPWTINTEFQKNSKLNVRSTVTDYESITRPYPSHRKMVNFLENSEHISRIDKIIHNRIEKVTSLKRCVAFLDQLSSSQHDRSLVRNSETTTVVNLVASDDSRLTVGRLQHSLTISYYPTWTNGKYVADRLMEELMAYIDNYYEPCFSALSQDDIGQVGGAMFGKPFTELEACSDLVCKYEDVEWENNRCISPALTLSENSEARSAIDDLVKIWCDPQLA